MQQNLKVYSHIYGKSTGYPINISFGTHTYLHKGVPWTPVLLYAMAALHKEVTMLSPLTSMRFLNKCADRYAINMWDGYNVHPWAPLVQNVGAKKHRGHFKIDSIKCVIKSIRYAANILYCTLVQTFTETKLYKKKLDLTLENAEISHILLFRMEIFGRFLFLVPILYISSVD